MGKPSAFYLVYNDEEGSFVNINKIQTVTTGPMGSIIHLKSGKTLDSPFKPRQILHKIKIIRHNMTLEKYERPKRTKRINEE